MIGQSLGHYHILEKLGSGGMGEVYKARDTRLNRMVAIKVLAPGTTSDPARKRRFIQEAQSASALNHPNIVVIHDINIQDGVDYMVMEYVDGKTHDALIPRQGMRLGEALKVAIPVASGLAAAHGANIIHRDIKPSNIIVAADGRVKVLDFGLAKLTEEAPGEENDPTRTERARTEEGAVLGTVAYMSPEQAEGKKLDARTDIFSFGALLYELVTGHRAFAGDSRVSTLSAILKEDPALPPGVPRDLDQILRRALRKDPARRFQHMDDLRVALEELKEESDSGRLTATNAVAPAPAAGNKWLWPGAALLLALAATGFIWQRTAGPAAPAPVAEYKLRQLTADSGFTTAPALSPDGKLLAYASDRATQSTLDIWVQPLTEGAQPIRITTDAADDSDPSFSPDGGQIVFWSQRDGGGLYLIPAHGGDERLLVRGGDDARFSPDGKWIAYCVGGNFLYDSKVFVIPASGGVARQVGAEIGWAAKPQWSPDGKWLMVDGMDGSNRSATREFWMVPMEGGKSVRTEIRKHLAERKLNFFGHDWRGDVLIIATGSEAWSVAVEPGSWKPGEPRKLVASTGLLRNPRGTPARFVFASANEQYHLWALPLDPRSAQVKGPARALPHTGGDQINPSLSRNGRLVYMQLSPDGREIRIREGLDGKDRVVATGNFRPEISPDGSRVAYSGYSASGGGGVYLVDAAGGQATEVLGPKERAVVFDWTPDGQRLLLWHDTPIRFSTIDPRTKQRQILISHPTLNIHTAALSPDGKWVTFVLTDRGRALMLAPVRDGKAADEAEWITILGAPAHQSRPWWSPDGKLLYFISDRDRYGCIWALRIHPATGHPVGEPIPVFHPHETRRSTMMGATPFGPALGEDQLVFGMLDQTANIWMAEPTAR